MSGRMRKGMYFRWRRRYDSDEEKVIDHIDEDHLCAAPVHACGKVSIG